MKHCYKCNKEKDINEFGKHKGKKDGRQPLCLSCVKQYRVDNAERFKSYDRDKYAKHGKAIRERTKKYRKENYEAYKKRNVQYRKDNLEKLQAYDKLRHRQKRLEVINRYGKICQCCDEDKIEFLCIDHIKGGGGEHRKQVGSGQSFYSWLLKNNPSQEEFRVLCFNCNSSLGMLGYCPHKKESEFKGIREDI